MPFNSFLRLFVPFAVGNKFLLLLALSFFLSGAYVAGFLLRRASRLFFGVIFWFLGFQSRTFPVTAFVLITGATFTSSSFSSVYTYNGPKTPEKSHWYQGM